VLGATGDGETFLIEAVHEIDILGSDLALDAPLDHSHHVVEVAGGVGEPVAAFLLFGAIGFVGLARGFDALDIGGFDVFAVDFGADFPPADVIGAELSALVVAVEGVDPASKGCCLGGLHLYVISVGCGWWLM